MPSAALPKLQASQGLVDHPQHPDSAYRLGSLRFAIKSTRHSRFAFRQPEYIASALGILVFPSFKGTIL